jgi:hypothetical protein
MWRVPRPFPRALALALVCAAGCHNPSEVTGASAAAPSPELARAAAQPTSRVQVAVLLGGASVATLDARYHESPNNEWLNLEPRQPAGVAVSGPGRVQFAGGRSEAQGVLTVRVGGSTLTVDLSQFAGLAQSPFVEDRPGGGCLVARGVLAGQGPPQEVEVMLEWGGQ